MNNSKLSVIQDIPNISLIEHLENLLDKAKSGELQELVYVCSYDDNTTNSGWSAIRNRIRLIGQIEQLKHNLMMGDE